jgi:pimeloyl-ACP methyl ester carboxylesterase
VNGTTALLLVPLIACLAACRATERTEAHPGWATLRLGAIRAPTLVIVGSRDVPDIQRIVELISRRVPGAQRIVLKDAGHVVNMEQPERFTSVVREFPARRGLAAKPGGA